MIKQLFILKATGTCVIHNNFDQIDSESSMLHKKDPQLISGFFSAILAFSESVVEGADNEISMMQLKNRLFYFYKIQSFYIILECSADDQTLVSDDYESILIDIGLIFEDSFLQDKNPDDIFFTIEDENFNSKIKEIISAQIRKKFTQRFQKE